MKTKIFLNIIVAFIVSFFPISLYATDTTNHQAEIKIRCIRDNYSVKLRWSTTNSEHWKLTNEKGFRLERFLKGTAHITISKTEVQTTKLSEYYENR